jgi:hypothetical protein
MPKSQRDDLGAGSRLLRERLWSEQHEHLIISDGIASLFDPLPIQGVVFLDGKDIVPDGLPKENWTHSC